MFTNRFMFIVCAYGHETFSLTWPSVWPCDDDDDYSFLPSSSEMHHVLFHKL